jgi:hypothetical protein
MKKIILNLAAKACALIVLTLIIVLSNSVKKTPDRDISGKKYNQAQKNMADMAMSAGY